MVWTTACVSLCSLLSVFSESSEDPREIKRGGRNRRREEVVSGITLHSFSVCLCTIGQSVYERVGDILCQEVLHREETLPMQPPQNIQRETVDVL